MITVQKYKSAIVDDSQEYRATVQSVLQSVAGKAGKEIECTQFSRAETLIYELDDGDAYFDIYVLDIQMPGINGIEAIREIKKSSPSVVFIILSASYTLPVSCIFSSPEGFAFATTEYDAPFRKSSINFFRLSGG